MCKTPFKKNKCLTIISMAILSISTQAAASDFNVPFINASGLGDAYADWATATDDASAAFSNPAGLVHLNHQQLVVAPLAILGNTKFTGTTTAPPPPSPLTQTGSASSRIGAVVPSIYYASPMWNKFVFAFSETVPFALGTNYPKDSIVRYNATKSQVVVFDIGPSVGYKYSDALSFGLGLDFNRLAFTLNNMTRSPFGGADFETQNHLAGWGYSWHGGIMYQALPTTRVGISFNSMVRFRATGDSENYASFGTFRTTNQKSYAGLPARTQVSVHHDINNRLTAMGTVFYTNWSTLNQITLQNVMAPGGSTYRISIPLEYHNTFDYSAGVSFKATDKWTLRTGLQFMNTPTNNRDRGVSDPVGSATVVGLGAHYQYNPALGYDLSYGHSFFKQEPVNLITPVATLSGHNNTQTNVFGAQVTWNIT